MMAIAEHQLSVGNRRLRLRARGDVRAVRVAFSGQSGHVLKDPVTLEMFHLTAEEFFLFEQLKRPISLGQLQSEFERQFPPRRVSVETLQGYLNQLHDCGLLVSEATGQGEQLVQRASRRRRSEWLQNAGRVLAIRFPGFDATRTLDWLYPKCRWLFSRGMLIVAVAMVLYAGAIVVGHAGEVAARLPSLGVLLEPRHLLLLVATIGGVKLLHELGHALACKHFGGRCHEMGVLLLVFAPSLYCDVSDVWRLPNKWHRMAVSAAGMAVELVLAALATIAWWHTQPGLLNIWCLNIVMVCSVGTLLVNANPLLRYDGYYLLADLVEVPNLGSRARGLVGRMLRHWLLAEPAEVDPLLGPGRQRGLVAYSLAAKIYLAAVLGGIFIVLAKLAQPHHLQNLVYTVALVALIGYTAPAMLSWWRWLRNPTVRARLRRLRLTVLTSTVAGAVAGVLFWPVAGQVAAPVVLVPADSQPLLATASGELRFAVQPGSHVRAGEVVAQLVDPATELALAEQTARCREHQLRREQLLALRVLDDRAGEQLPTVEAALADAEAQLAEQRREAERLVLLAPRAGQVIAPPDRPRHTGRWDSAAESQLARWSGSPLATRNLGCWIESGTMLCAVADPARLEAWVAVDEADIAEVHPGQQVRLLLEQLPGRVLDGKVVEVARRSTCDGSGQPDRPAASLASALRNEPARCYHVVRVALDASDALLLVGARGQAKVETSNTTLSAIAARFLRRTFRLPW